jgi:membrane protein DedA with SNARE-associated domain
MLTLHFIKHFVEVHSFYAYILIFLGVIIEGEVVVIFAGIFSYLGSLNITVSFLTVIIAGYTKSFLGYYLGLYLQKKHSHRLFLGKIEKRILYFFPRFCQKPFWSIFISRFFIFGMQSFTLIFSGYKKIPMKIYLKAESFSLIIWSIIMLSLGHFFGFTALSISKDIRHIFGIIILCFISFFVIEKIVAIILEFFDLKENNL